MAPPPPPASASLQERLLALAQTLQFAWFCGHLTLIFCTFRYGLSYITFNAASKWATFSYRTTFVAASVTYGIVVYKAFRARTRQGKPGGAGVMLRDENVQYLAMALLWLFLRQIPLAILPFAVYSIFHVATYTRSNLLPALQPAPTTPGAKAKPSAIADTIGRFVKDYYDASMSLVAFLEIALWFRVLGSALLFQKTSWILLVAYTVFFRSRYGQSQFVQGSVKQISARVDAQLANQSTPPAARQAWATVKSVIGQVVDATDFNRLGGAGASTGPKKAQ